jgi:hypothetical protein
VNLLSNETRSKRFGIEKQDAGHGMKRNKICRRARSPGMPPRLRCGLVNDALDWAAIRVGAYPRSWAQIAAKQTARLRLRFKVGWGLSRIKSRAGERYGRECGFLHSPCNRNNYYNTTTPLLREAGEK